MRYQGAEELEELGNFGTRMVGLGVGRIEQNRSGRWGLLTVQSTCSSLVLKRERMWKPSAPPAPLNVMLGDKIFREVIQLK